MLLAAVEYSTIMDVHNDHAYDSCNQGCQINALTNALTCYGVKELSLVAILKN